MAEVTTSLEFAQIQGLILRGYTHPFARYLFFRIPSGTQARVWLKHLVDNKRITVAEKWTEKPKTFLNIAFTATGLEALGLSDDTMSTFSEEFRHGIQNRSDILGDTGTNAPDHWEVGAPEQVIHGLLMLYGEDEATLDAFTTEQQGLMESMGGLEIVSVQSGYRPADSHEHFGFMDGISQPAIEGLREPTPKEGPAIKVGEFVMGYPNEYGVLPPMPAPEPLGRNGSYLVYRKLHQNVAAFWNYVRENSEDEGEAEWIAAKMVGRWRNGTPLVVSPDGDVLPTNGEHPRLNDFNYADTDLEGYGAPIGSHIRRTNPRDLFGGDSDPSYKSSNRHRIIRRGMSYGPPLKGKEDDGQDRGIHFFCVNANIAIQFEFTQQTWVNNAKFHGLYNDKDPFAHNNDGKTDMTIQREPYRKRLRGMPNFVTVRGGAYFFLPSIAALEWLAALDPEQGGKL
jgi:Dyp-type peroxidase family